MHRDVVDTQYDVHLPTVQRPPTSKRPKREKGTDSVVTLGVMSRMTMTSAGLAGMSLLDMLRVCCEAAYKRKADEMAAETATAVRVDGRLVDGLVDGLSRGEEELLKVLKVRVDAAMEGEGMVWAAAMARARPLFLWFAIPAKMLVFLLTRPAAQWRWMQFGIIVKSWSTRGPTPGMPIGRGNCAPNL